MKLIHHAMNKIRQRCWSIHLILLSPLLQVNRYSLYYDLKIIPNDTLPRITLCTNKISSCIYAVAISSKLGLYNPNVEIIKIIIMTIYSS